MLPWCVNKSCNETDWLNNDDDNQENDSGGCCHLAPTIIFFSQHLSGIIFRRDHCYCCANNHFPIITRIMNNINITAPPLQSLGDKYSTQQFTLSLNNYNDQKYFYATYPFSHHLHFMNANYKLLYRISKSIRIKNISILKKSNKDWCDQRFVWDWQALIIKKI